MLDTQSLIAVKLHECTTLPLSSTLFANSDINIGTRWNIRINKVSAVVMHVLFYISVHTS